MCIRDRRGRERVRERERVRGRERVRERERGRVREKEREGGDNFYNNFTIAVPNSSFIIVTIITIISFVAVPNTSIAHPHPIK